MKKTKSKVLVTGLPKDKYSLGVYFLARRVKYSRFFCKLGKEK